MPLDNVVHIEFPDDETPPRTEKEQRVDLLVENVRKKAKEIAREAVTLSDYVRAFYLDYLYGSYDGLAWIFDQSPEGISIEELVDDLENGDSSKEVSKKVLAIEEMKKVLDAAPDREGYVKVTVKKIRRGGDVLGFRVLAEFPDGTLIPHTGFDDNAVNCNDGKQVIYYQPNAACFCNAFSDANAESLKNQGSAYKVYYLPVMDTETAQNNILVGANGVAEYILGRDDEGNKIKQNMDSYLWVALVNRGYKEDLLFRVSDYWKREVKTDV